VEVTGIEPVFLKETIIPTSHTFRIRFNLIYLPK